jgi:hypothetical protein
MRTFTIFCFQFFICFSLYAAHGGSIKGVVIASYDNDLLVGVSVRLQENGLTTTTNEIGYFHFPDLENGTYTIVASYLGYETSSQRINVNNHETSSIRLFMVEKALALADVEINAQKRDALQSISQLDVQLPNTLEAAKQNRFFYVVLILTTVQTLHFLPMVFR